MKRFILITLSCLLAQTAWAGWVVTYKDAETGELSKKYYDGNKANLKEMIYDGSRFYVVHDDSRAYWKGSASEYCDALKAWTEKMQAQMSALFPEQYKPVPISQKSVTRKEVGTQSIAGFSATGYDFFVNGNQEDQIWLSSDSRLSGIINQEAAMEKKLQCLDGMSNMSLEGAALYKKTIKGKFMLKELFREVVSVESKKVDSSHFTVPGGYKAFSDYGKFMEYASNHSGSSSASSSESMTYPSQEDAEYSSEEETSSEPQGDNVIVKDAKEIANGAVGEAHQSTKRGIQDGISDDIQDGVKKFLDKFF